MIHRQSQDHFYFHTIHFKKMILLTSTSEILKVVLAGSITTNQLDLSAEFIERTTTNTDTAEMQNDTVTNSTTPVTIVAAPASSRTRIIKKVSIYNADTVSATVIVQKVTASGTRVEIKVTLLTLEKLNYEDGQGWYTTTSDGNRKILSAANITQTVNQNVTTTAPSEDAVFKNGLAVTMSGTNTYTGTCSPVIQSYVTNWNVLCYFGTQNTTNAPTVNFNSLGAKTVVKTSANTTVTVTAGDLQGYQWLTYDGTNFRISGGPADSIGNKLFLYYNFI